MPNPARADAVVRDANRAAHARPETSPAWPVLAGRTLLAPSPANAPRVARDVPLDVRRRAPPADGALTPFRTGTSSARRELRRVGGLDGAGGPSRSKMSGQGSGRIASRNGASVGTAPLGAATTTHPNQAQCRQARSDGVAGPRPRSRRQPTPRACRRSQRVLLLPCRLRSHTARLLARLEEWRSERRCAREWSEVIRPDAHGNRITRGGKRTRR